MDGIAEPVQTTMGLIIFDKKTGEIESTGPVRRPSMTFVRENAIPQGAMVADRRLHLDADGNIVEEGDPKSAYLFIGKGGIIHAEEVRAHNLRFVDGAVVYGPDKTDGGIDPEASDGTTVTPSVTGEAANKPSADDVGF